MDSFIIIFCVSQIFSSSYRSSKLSVDPPVAAAYVKYSAAELCIVIIFFFGIIAHPLLCTGILLYYSKHLFVRQEFLKVKQEKHPKLMGCYISNNAYNRRWYCFEPFYCGASDTMSKKWLLIQYFTYLLFLSLIVL
jgi:hypothetical protein